MNDFQYSAEIMGNTFICLKCGYRKEIATTYPQRDKDIIDTAAMHECKKPKVIKK